VRVHIPLRRTLLPVVSLLFLCVRFSGAEERIPLPLPLRSGSESGTVKWGSLLRQSSLFLGIQHSFRIAAEDDTRAGLGGPFLGGWPRSVNNLHGWADGDPFIVNYVGHPIEGAIAGFLFVQNDPKYQKVEFGRNREYWRGRLRAAGWAWAYSTQFEIGPLSEASLGNVQSHFPQQGFVDHVITPAIGLSWIIAEDAVDKYLIRRIEARTDNRTVRILARGVLNPSRSMANVLRGSVPWHRDTREGVAVYRTPAKVYQEPLDFPDEYRNDRRYAPFEFAAQYGYTQLGMGASGSQSCNGGSATVLFNVSLNLGIEAEVGGCKVVSPEQDVSADSTVFLAGPRYTFRDLGRWSPFIHALGGGEKLTSETLYPDRKPPVTPDRSNKDGYNLHALYTSNSESTAFALQVGGGVDYTINRALALRVANVEYLHTYGPEFNGVNPRSNLRFTTGLVLRMGTW
jgi:opacity protein-like surface antigen